MIASISYLFLGIVLLYAGAEGLVRGSASMALRLGLTRLVVGLTIVAFGTSSPELVVSVKASLDGNGAISLGNVIGSNICNIAVILGLAALVNPLHVNAQVVRLQIPIMIAASLLLPLLLIDGRLNRLEGLLLFSGIIGYTTYTMCLARKESRERETQQNQCQDIGQVAERKSWINVLFILSGLALLLTGARLFLSGAIEIAKYLDVNQAVIGLTIVAVGTSLPELATSLVAAIKREGDIAVGNVVGSNIFNILGILGLAALISPMEMGEISGVDLAVMIAIGLLVLPLMRSGFLLNRWEGALLLAFYAGYIYYLWP